MKGRIIALGVFLALILAGVAYLSTFSLKKIEITGCVLSSEESIEKKIRENAIMENTLAVYLQNRFKPIENVPFVAKLDIEYKDKNTLTVEVYEKSVAGCIEYMESYVYFDKDGIVLETAKSRYDKIPNIKGLTIKSWELGEELPIENKKKFELILNITQLVDKYDLDIQGIEFTNDGEVVLRHDNIEIELGDGSNLPIQMMNLGGILKEIEGKSGVLYMKEFDSENSTASFKVR
ncbi:MAG: hypothetical protein K6B68_03170 [Eubacterium sp.]|nr:hypothetical protein [Eubacterium sp.]